MEEFKKCLLDTDSHSCTTESEKRFLEEKSNFLGDTYESYIMGNITIPLEYIHKGKFYKDYDQDNQKLILEDRIMKLLNHKKVKDIIYNSKGVNSTPLIFHEKHKNNNMHSHILFRTYEDIFGYQYHLDVLNKRYKALVKGRKISGLFKYVFDYEGALKYCKKNQ